MNIDNDTVKRAYDAFRKAERESDPNEIYLTTMLNSMRAALEVASAARSEGTLAASLGEVLPDDATNLEVIQHFIHVGRTMQPIGHWPGERLYAAIERHLNAPHRFIAAEQMSERRGHNGRGGDEDKPLRPVARELPAGSGSGHSSAGDAP